MREITSKLKELRITVVDQQVELATMRLGLDTLIDNLDERITRF